MARTAVRRAPESDCRKRVNDQLRANLAPATQSLRAGRNRLKTKNKIAVGAGILLMGASLLAMRPHSPGESAARITQAHLRLASLSTDSRRDVDYRQLDSRLRELIKKPAMVGLAVGVVENGRIT